MQLQPDLQPDLQHFTSESAGHITDLIMRQTLLSSEEAHALLKLGAVYVNAERQLKDKLLPAGSQIRVHMRPRRYNCDHPWTSLIIFENDFFLILNKPAGVPSHPTVDNAVENALTQVSLARGFNLFVTHRLDTLTSGLIVFAKKSSFAKDFNLQMQNRSVRKKYAALVESEKKFPLKLSHYLNPAPGTPKQLSDQPVAGWALCELEILTQKIRSDGLSQVKINLLTGRTHQIRSQFSFIQAPVVGDKLYGAQLAFKENAIALRSCELEFDFNGERVKFSLRDDFDF